MTIRSKSSHAAMVWDWGFLDARGFVGDIDGFHECNGCALLLEGKLYGAPLSGGYRMAFEMITKYNSISVIVVWGIPPNDVHAIQVWHQGKPGPIQETDNEGLRTAFLRWRKFAQGVRR